MPARRLVRAAWFMLAAGASICLLDRSAPAQSVIDGGFPSDWEPIVTPPPRHFFGPEYDGVSGISGNGVGMHAAAQRFPDDTFTLLSTRGTVVNSPDKGDPADAFRWQVSRDQTFTLLDAANVSIPMFFKGNIQLGGTSANFGLATARVEIYDSTNTSRLFVTDGTTRVGFVDGTGSFGIDSFRHDTVLLPAGDYRVRTTLEIGGEGGSISSPGGASAKIDFFTKKEDGVGASIYAVPLGLTSSRVAVKAIEARAYIPGGLTGAGVEVGMVEPGAPYTTHSSVSAAGKMEFEEGGFFPPPYSSEHALATAGIVAGEDASPDNAGVAPGATLRCAPTLSHAPGFQNAVGSLLSANSAMRVMSASVGLGTMTTAQVAFINEQVNSFPNLTFVKSAGNGDDAGTITDPGLAENIITVGAVNRDFTRRAEFSSFGAPGGLPMKPDIMAPGEYINAPVSRDINSDGMVNDFRRGFLGDDYKYDDGPNSGDISGTSFATPHVAGAAALLHEYQMDHPGTHSADHRVIKAILLNGASTSVKHQDGAPWSQKTTGAMPGLVVTRSLDEETGAGMLDCLQSIKNYQPAEVLAGHANASSNRNIPATSGGGFVWDFERVVSGAGKVNYLLGDVTGAHLRATLTWDFDVMGGTGLMPLELRFYEESAAPGNPTGWDSADLLIAETSLAGENVKLFDFTVGDFNSSRSYFLQVIDTGGSSVLFGIAISVPEPAVQLALLLLANPLLRRRRFL